MILYNMVILKKRKQTASAAIIAGVALLATPLIAGAVGTSIAGPGDSDPNNWTQYHRTSNAWRYSPLEQINKSNVKNLKAA